MATRVILDLCGGTGAWSRPYLEAGYDVRLVDPQVWGGEGSGDVRTLLYQGPVHGILAAPPCTHLAVSGARWWASKGEKALLEALAVADACMRAVLVHRPKWWALENPVGRLRHYYGPPSLVFNPCDYGDPYTKKTLVWGEFEPPAKNPVKPIRVCPQGSWVQKLGGTSDKTKRIRSQTPAGWARAFFEANP